MTQLENLAVQATSSTGDLSTLVLCAFIAFFVYITVRRNRQTNRKVVVAKTHERHLVGYEATPREVLEHGLALVQEADSEFQFAVFAKRCARMFKAIHLAVAQEELQATRHLMSDGLFERLQLMTAMRRGIGRRFIEQNLRVKNVEAIAFGRSGPFDVIQVRIEAEGIHFYIDPEQPVIASIDAPTKYSEYWSFSRLRGAQTSGSGSIAETTCPSCASPLSITDKGMCDVCQTTVIGGVHDWIATEITQVTAGSVGERDVAGYQELVNKDPGFHLQAVEDRMSVIFWRERAAEFFGEPMYLANVASRRLVQGRRSITDGIRETFADLSVGTVEVVAISPSRDEQTPDYIRLTVKWAGYPIRAKIPCKLPAWSVGKNLFTTDYVLGRHSAAKSAVDRGMLSLHCYQCGYPYADTGTGSCGACGTHFNDGTQEWILVEQGPIKMAA